MGRGRPGVLLSAVALLLTGVWRAAPAPATDPFVYAALGDSYTSGPLVLPHDQSRVPEGCAQSVENYPHRVAAALGVDELRDVSCAGAKIDHLYVAQSPLADGGTARPQLEVLDASVDLVTVSLSGNDVTYLDVLMDCVRAAGPPAEQPCVATYTAGFDQLRRKIDDVAPELSQALRDVRARAPRARIFVVGYPTALPDDGVACWPYVPLLAEDVPWLADRYKDLNAMVAAQAASNGVAFVDLYRPSIGHDVCQAPAQAWVNGFVVTPPSYPVHPNQLGMTEAAAAVTAAIRAGASGPPSS